MAPLHSNPIQLKSSMEENQIKSVLKTKIYQKKIFVFFAAKLKNDYLKINNNCLDR